MKLNNILTLTNNHLGDIIDVMKIKQCIDCGKVLGDYRSIRCRKCSNTTENHPNWKGKSLPRYCMECGNLIKTKGWGKRANIKYCGSCKQKGKRSPNWKGGLTPQRMKEYNTPEYKKFVNEVLQRDNWICQKCGIKNGTGFNVRLEVHHIKSYAENPELRFDVSNGITLCKKCHIETRQGMPRPSRIDKIFTKKVCTKCGKEFQKRNPKKYCDECKKIICKYCGKIFLWKNSRKNQIFCSGKCYGKWWSENKTKENNPHWKEKIAKKCLICDREYYIKPSLNNTSKFCSLKCRNVWQSKRMIGNDYRKR